MKLEKANVVKITKDSRKIERLKEAGFYEVDEDKNSKKEQKPKDDTAGPPSAEIER